VIHAAGNGALLVYGASGFTGRLIVQQALARGLRPILAGRDRERIEALARPNQLEWRAASLEDEGALRRMLKGVSVVLNAAGPFRMTAQPLSRACLESRVHYLDIGGEYATVELLAGLHAAALERGCMILPSVGFDVVASDCMAAWVAQRLPGACSLWIGITGLNAISRGSAETVLDQDARGVAVRRDGLLGFVTPGSLVRQFDFGQGLRRATAVGWVDVASAYYTTLIPNITVYYEETALLRLGQSMTRYGSLFRQAPAVRLLQGAALRMMAPGPTPAQRAAGQATVVVQAEDVRGFRQQVRLHTPEVYSFTATTSVAIADWALGGQIKPGFQTPARALGAEYVLSLPGVKFEPQASHFAS
jgi:short subunit dehydrogenase-like uncharacterized protein